MAKQTGALNKTTKVHKKTKQGGQIKTEIGRAHV